MRRPEELSQGSPIDSATAARAQAMCRKSLLRYSEHDRIGRLLVGRQLGDYGLLRRIGCGERCWVFLARHLTTGIGWAIKILNRSVAADFPDGERWFLEHTRAAISLNHLQIVRSEEAKLDERTTAVTMEYLPGFTVAHLVRALGRLSCTAAAAIARQVAEALAYLHTRGFIHRQIEPHHIVVGSEGGVKLIGLSAICPTAASRLAQAPMAEAILHRPDYRAPEFSLPDPVDFPADFYALGATVFEMLSGDLWVPAFPQPAPAEDRFRPIARCGAIGAVTERLLAPNPTDRYGSHAELIAELRLAQVSG